MSCRWYARVDGRYICVNPSYHYGLSCAVEPCQKLCQHFEPGTLIDILYKMSNNHKIPAEQKKISDKELMQECEKYNITVDKLISDCENSMKEFFTDCYGCEMSMNELKNSNHYLDFLKRALNLKLLKELKEYNTVK